MFVFKICTTRPNTNDPFFPFSPIGQQYEALMDEAKATRPTEGVYALLGVEKTISPDALTLTTKYTFETPYGKEALLDNFAVRVITNGLGAVNEARDDYNQSVGHTSSVTFEKVEPQA